MIFFQLNIEYLVYYRFEIWALKTAEPGCKLGIKHCFWMQTEQTKAFKVLGGGVKNPFTLVDDRGEDRFHIIALAFRGDEESTRVSPMDLDEESAIVVTKCGGAFGVDCKRTPTSRQGVCRSAV